MARLQREYGPEIDFLDYGDVNYGFNGPGWYFWDEIYWECYGPYETLDQAIANLNLYAEELERGHESPRTGENTGGD